MTSTDRSLPRACLLAASLAVLVACGSAPGPALGPAPRLAAPRPAAAPGGVSLVAAATGRSVAVYPRAGAGRASRVLASPNRDGFRLVFLVRHAAAGWLEVYLPVRPNGATGWLRRGEVTLTRNPYLVRIDLRRHRFSLRRRGAVIDRGRIGVGRAVTPTPAGVYFLTELFRLTSPSGPYGPYGFGLSAYSDVLHEFAGADGQIGLHGTNDPAGIGSDVSHGCIRLANAEITRLARLLPLGTPVRILRG